MARSSTAARSRSSTRSSPRAPTRRSCVCTPRSRRRWPSRSSPADAAPPGGRRPAIRRTDTPRGPVPRGTGPLRRSLPRSVSAQRTLLGENPCASTGSGCTLGTDGDGPRSSRRYPMSEWFRPAGSASRHGFDVALGPREAGWEHTGLNVLTLAPGERREIRTGDCEWLVLPLAGKCRVESATGDKVLFLDGRRDPFAGPTDFAYVPRMSRFAVVSTAGARLAMPHAKAENRAAVPPHPRRGGGDRAPRRRPRLAPGPQLRYAGRAQRRLDHRLRGADPGRQLVLLPAAQARRGAPGPRERAGGDLLLRDARGRRGDVARARGRSATSGSTAPEAGRST